jgi:alpha-L-fucosidase 2
MWARLERGDKTGALIQAATPGMAGNILRQGTGSQVDAPFGFTAGIAEALIQSHAGEISLLPALPAGWADAGEVYGLRARGGYTVNMKWEKGRLVSAEISNPGGGVSNVRYNGKVTTVTVPAGEPAILK